MRHGGHLRRHPPERGAGEGAPASTFERGIVVDDGMATSDPAICAVGECAQHRGMVYGLVAPLWEQTAALADRADRPRRGQDLRRLAHLDEAQGDGRRTRRAWARSRDATPTTRSCTYAEPGRGVYRKLIVRDGKLAGAILLGDTSAAPALQQLFDRSTPAARLARVAALPDAARRRRRCRLADLPGRRPDLRLQRRLQGRHRRRDARRLPHPQGGLQRDPGRHRLRLVQGPGQGDRRGGRRRRPAGRSVGALLRAGRADGQAGADRRHQGDEPAQRLAGVRRARRRHGEDPGSKAGLASLLKTHLGHRRTSTSATRASSTTASTPTSRRTAPSASSRASTAA